MQTVYEAAGGADGLLRLARAWHAVPKEDNSKKRRRIATIGGGRRS